MSTRSVNVETNQRSSAKQLSHFTHELWIARSTFAKPAPIQIIAADSRRVLDFAVAVPQSDLVFDHGNGKTVRYTKEEISRARDLRKGGLDWRPRLGDWFVTDDGFVAFVQGNGDGLHAKLHHTWLPHWAQCREWLRRHGFTHPEFARDDIGHIRIEFIGPQHDIVSGTGGTDLACIYEIMSKIIERKGRPPT